MSGAAPFSRLSKPLAERLADRIRRDGPLRFDPFQEAALYDPVEGYYERAGRVGRGGDFVTGPTWHPAFGRTIARIARRLLEEKKEKEKSSAEEREEEKDKNSLNVGKREREQRAGASRELVDLVDIGAGEGELLRAADEALRAWGIRDEFRLIGIERSAARRGIAAARVPDATWVASVEDIPNFRAAGPGSGLNGLIVAYELFDALPVRALFFDGERLRERVVTLGPGGDGFAWDVAECADADELLRQFEARGIHLRRNQNLEVRTDAARLANSLAARLSSGLLLVFDYGAPAKALYSAAWPNGTLEAFHGHEVSRDVLVDPGGRDITAWVDFTDLADAFRSSGLTVAGPVSQARVLAAAGIGVELGETSDETPDATPSAERAAERNAIARLVAPGGMGESIRVLAASRDSAVAATLLDWPRPAQSRRLT